MNTENGYCWKMFLGNKKRIELLWHLVVNNKLGFFAVTRRIEVDRFMYFVFVQSSNYIFLDPTNVYKKERFNTYLKKMTNE